jgi:hypothetical protein
MTKKKRVEAPSASLPAEWELADAAALQALSEGTADAEQQKRVLKWWINQCATTYDLSYRPGDTHDTAFAEGRRFCGLQTVKLIKVNIAAMRRGETK